MRRRALARGTLPAAAFAVAIFALAGCGGGGGGSSEGETTTTRTSAANYDPAEEIISKAGLEVCEQSELQGADVGPTGFQGSRSFAVAPDCSKDKGKPTIIVAQAYTTPDQVAAQTKVAQKANPEGIVFSYRTIVVTVNGPHAGQYGAKIETALKQQTS